jgi:hypothetical protein
MSVPGVGPIISSAMVAAIGTGDSFPRVATFVERGYLSVMSEAQNFRRREVWPPALCVSRSRSRARNLSRERVTSAAVRAGRA